MRNDAGQVKHPHLYWEFYEGGGKQAVLKGKWKGVRLDVRKGTPVFELYDLSVDPGERNNMADQHQDVVAELLKIMENEHVEIPAISLYSMETNADMAY